MHSLLFFQDLDSRVWAPELAEPTADAIGGAGPDRLVFWVHLQNLFGAKSSTDAAAFAPFGVDDDFFLGFGLGFLHFLRFALSHYMLLETACEPVGRFRQNYPG
jgi:hypothetical protein